MSDLETAARELISLLDRERSCLEATAVRFRTDRQALISGRGTVLEGAVQAWQELAAQRKDLDRNRALLMDRISRLLDLPADRLNVTRISSCLSKPLGARLRHAGELVRVAAREAALEAAVGRDLLEESARFHEGLLRAITAAVDAECPAYGQKKTNGSATVTMVDRTA